MKTGFNKAKQYALNLTDVEIKVEEATNNDPWGPHGTAMTGASSTYCDALSESPHPASASLKQ